VAGSRDVESRPGVPADALGGVSDEPRATADALDEPAAEREREHREGERCEQEVQLHVRKTNGEGSVFPDEFRLTSRVSGCNRGPVTTVIVIGALWVGNVLFLRWLGGVGAASDALARWGRATAEKRRRRLASHS
jgi:hypothetical protein